MASGVIRKFTLLEKLRSGIYDLYCLPVVLQINCYGVYVHKKGLRQNEIRSLQLMMKYRSNPMRFEPKLIGKSGGDFNFYALFVGVKHFRSRKQLDDLYLKKYGDPKCTYQTYDSISFQEALRQLNVDISVNMQYYFKYPLELEKDLGHKVEYLFHSAERFNFLESELLHSHALKLFGGYEESKEVSQVSSSGEMYGKTFKFKDFRLLYSDGNYTIATACCNSKYFLLHYDTS